MGNRRARLVLAGAVVVLFVVLDLVAGALLTATGTLDPIDRGDLRAEVEEQTAGLMRQPPIGEQPWAPQHAADMAAFELADNETVPYLARTHHEFRSPTVNVSETERVSYRPETPPGVEPLQIAFFGGSVLFGVGQRDEHSIPSAFARLAEQAGVAVEVHNLGFPAWVSWQEMLLFERRLAAGADYDLAVFLHGFNDFQMLAQDFEDGPTFHSAGIVRGLVHELRKDRAGTPGPLDGVGELLTSYRRASGTWRVVDALREREEPMPGADSIDVAPPERVAEVALDNHARAMALVEDLAVDSGTPVRFFWQPSRAGWPPEVLQQLPEDVIDLSDVFAGDVTPFYDHVHTAEAGAAVIAQAMWDELAPELRALAEAGVQPAITRPGGTPAG